MCTVLDPTFLLNKDEWDKIAKKSSLDKSTIGKYIFCYFIGNNSEWQIKVKKYAEEMGLKILTALSESYIIPDVGEYTAAYGVEDFIYLLQNAEIVVTDSFHACAISINFNKDFFVFERFSNDNKFSQNSRIYDLLEMFSLKNRIVNRDISLNDEKINYNFVNSILASKVDESKMFINHIMSKEVK